jgi:hypothetical protein
MILLRSAMRTEGDPGMPNNYWSVICPEPEAPGLWRTWLNEKCVAIGWPPSRHHLEGSTDKPGWDIARARAQKIAPGDIIVPYLLRYRFGIPGEVVKVAITDVEWRPTVQKGGYAPHPDEPQLGRRIEVRWLRDRVPPLDKIVVVPIKNRIPGGMAKQTIDPLKPDKYAKFMAVIEDRANWVTYEPFEPHSEIGTDEQPEPSTEPEPSKLAIQETLIRSILAKNLHHIEAGLKAHPDFKHMEEVIFELGRLDLLCMDSKQRTTIIELQLGSLDDGHIGKTCRYFGWFAAKYDAVRAILLFENATPGVLEAYRRAVPWLELRKYAFSAEIKMEPSQLVQV